MDSCERKFGVRLCSNLGEGICALAANEAWIGAGDVRDPEPIVKYLIQAGFEYSAKIYLLHSPEAITDERVMKFLHPSYARCAARGEIAEMAKRALRALTGDEVADPDALGRIVFRIG